MTLYRCSTPNSGDPNTVTFKCDDEIFKVPLASIHAKSKPLSDALSLVPFSSDSKHPAALKRFNTITFPPTSLSSIEKLAHYLTTTPGSYLLTSAYSSTNWGVTEDETCMTTAVTMYLLGQEFQLLPLISKGKDVLSTALIQNWDISKFVTVLSSIFMNLPATEELKEIVVNFLVRNPLNVTDLDADCDEGGYHDMVAKIREEHGWDIYGIVREAQKVYVKENRTTIPDKTCPGCGLMGVLVAVEVTRGEYYCTECVGMVCGRVPGVWYK